MANDGQYSVHYPTLHVVREALDDCHAGLTTAVGQSQGCTAVADAYPAWATSGAVRDLYVAHAARITGHSDDIAGYAARLASTISNYQSADGAAAASVASIRFGGGV